MKQSSFSKLSAQPNFSIGFQGAMALIISEIIDWYTTKDEAGNFIRNESNIDKWDLTRVNYAYSLRNNPDCINKFVNGMRALFPLSEADETNKYSPFVLTENPNENDTQTPLIADVDDVETILYERIKTTGIFNYWANVKPDYVGISNDGSENNTFEGGTMR